MDGFSKTTFTDEEKIAVFNKLQAVVYSYLEEINSGDLSDDGEWEAKNNLHYEFLGAFFKEREPFEKEQLREEYSNDINEALNCYSNFLKTPNELVSSIEEIFQKRESLEKFNQQDVLDVYEVVYLDELDDLFQEKYDDIEPLLVSNISIKEYEEKYNWFKKIVNK